MVRCAEGMACRTQPFVPAWLLSAFHPSNERTCTKRFLRCLRCVIRKCVSRETGNRRCVCMQAAAHLSIPATSAAWQANRGQGAQLLKNEVHAQLQRPRSEQLPPHSCTRVACLGCRPRGVHPLLALGHLGWGSKQHRAESRGAALQGVPVARLQQCLGQAPWMVSSWSCRDGMSCRRCQAPAPAHATKPRRGPCAPEWCPTGSSHLARGLHQNRPLQKAAPTPPAPPAPAVHPARRPRRRHPMPGSTSCRSREVERRLGMHLLRWRHGWHSTRHRTEGGCAQQLKHPSQRLPAPQRGRRASAPPPRAWRAPPESTCMVGHGMGWGAARHGSGMS